MHLQNGGHMPYLIQAQGLGLLMDSVLGSTDMGLAVQPWTSTCIETKWEAAFSVVCGVGGQRLNPIVVDTLDISS